MDKANPTSTEMTKTRRLESIDWLRGFVMIIMTLDHVREFLSPSDFNPLSAPDVSVLMYTTRWITNLCAPAFVLLAGVSAGLLSKRQSTRRLSRFLFYRGLWLVFLDATVITFALKFNFTNSPAMIMLSVLWAIGASMVVLSGLIFLPHSVILIAGLVTIAGSNLLDGILPVGGIDVSRPLWLGVHRQIIWQFGELKVLVGYPVLAWSGLMFCGYGLAPVFSWQAHRRQVLLSVLGGVLLVLFFILRLSNVYGDSNHWASGDTFTHTVMAFLNVTKYPPSLLFTSVTIGLTLPLLALADRWRFPLYNQFIQFGRVPLFYYTVHLYVVHILALLTALIQGYPASAWFVDPFINKPKGIGFSLPVIYLIWICVLLGLYPACRWFADQKAKRNDWWLSYL